MVRQTNGRLLLFLLLLAPMFCMSQNATTRSYHLPEGVSQADFLPGKLIVKIRDSYRQNCGNQSISVQSLQQAMGLAGVVKIEKAFPGKEKPTVKKDKYGRELADLSLIYTLDINPSVSPEFAADLFVKSDAVEYAEPWFVQQTFLTPNDPYYGDQYYMGVIHASEAFDLSQGDSAIVVGVIDTGTSFTHPEFQGKFHHNTGDPVNGIDDDNDGYTDNYYGWDFGGPAFGSGGDNNPTWMGAGPGKDHGVLVTGPMAATTGNGAGIGSAGNRCKILPMKACVDNSLGISWGYQAIVYGVDHGATILNLSWGGVGYNQFGRDAVIYASVNKGAMLVAAAGNYHSEIAYYPASFPEVMSVAGTSYVDNVWTGNYGSGTSYNTMVDICAPAEAIYTTAQYQDYWAMATGTSLASPIVAGVAALVKSEFPHLDMMQVRERVRVTSDDVYTVNPQAAYQYRLGHGRVNAYRALSAVTPSVRVVSMNIEDHHNGIIEFGDTIDIWPTFMNYLDPVSNLVISMHNNTGNSWFQLIDSTVYVGPIQGATPFNTPLPFRAIVKANAAFAQGFPIIFNYSDAGTNYTDFEFSSITVNPSVLNLTVNQLHMSVSNHGMIGYYSNQPQPTGLGISWNSGNNMSDYGNFIIGDALRVSDLGLDVNGYFDTDLYPQIRYAMDTNASTGEVRCRTWYDDEHSPDPLHVSVEQRVYASPVTGEDDYIIFEYQISNNGQDTLSNLFAGMNNTWDMVNGIGGFDTTARIAWFQDGANHYAGIRWLTPGAMMGGHYDNDNFMLDTYGKAGRISSVHDNYTPYPGLSMHYATTGGIHLSPGQSCTIAFAIIGASDSVSLNTAGQSAQWKYNCIIHPVLPFAGLGADLPLCPGNSVALNAGPGYSQYAWSGGASSQSVNVNTPSQMNVTVTDLNGCTFSDTVNVTAGIVPSISLLNNYGSCTDITLNGGSNAVSWLWSTGETTQHIAASQTGSYSVQALSADGCAAYDTTQVTITPFVALFSGPAAAVNTGQQVSFSDASTGANTWNWNFGDGVTSALGPNVNHIYNQPGIYTVLLTTSNGICTDTASLQLTVNTVTGVAGQLNTNDLHVFPSTNEGSFHLSTGDALTGSFTVRVCAANGALVWSNEYSDNRSEVLDIDLGSNIAQGMYTVSVISEVRTISAKIVVRK